MVEALRVKVGEAKVGDGTVAQWLRRTFLPTMDRHRAAQYAHAAVCKHPDQQVDVAFVVMGAVVVDINGAAGQEGAVYIDIDPVKLRTVDPIQVDGREGHLINAALQGAAAEAARRLIPIRIPDLNPLADVLGERLGHGRLRRASLGADSHHNEEQQCPVAVLKCITLIFARPHWKTLFF